METRVVHMANHVYLNLIHDSNPNDKFPDSDVTFVDAERSRAGGARVRHLVHLVLGRVPEVVIVEVPVLLPSRRLHIRCPRIKPKIHHLRVCDA